MLVCSVPVISLLFNACIPEPPFATGYVEGEYVMIAPVTTAQIDVLHVTRGQRVATGDLLVDMEKRDAEIALSQSEAGLARADSQLADLREGKRPEEIQVIEASLTSAKAEAEEADRSRIRIESLWERGAATETQRDDAATSDAIAKAKVAEIEANLAVARLPAREQEIAAAEAALRGAQADLDRSHWSLDKRQLTAPSNGVIYDVIRNPGEIAGPTAPVLSMLPDDGIKLRLYVSEQAISRIAPGSSLSVNCDSCPPGLTAKVTYVADGPEFTPPVIYSLENRQKLVYMIEAVADQPGSLRPGQIVDVTLPDQTK